MGDITIKLFVCVLFFSCKDGHHKAQQTILSETPGVVKKVAADSISRKQTVLLDTAIQALKVEMVYHWKEEALIIHVNNLIHDTSRYYISEGWDLYTPIFKFKDSTQSNIYIKNNFICLALPYNHVNPLTVLVYKINYTNNTLEICQDLKCSDIVHVNDNMGVLSTYSNADPVNGVVKRKREYYKIGQCFSKN